MADEEHTRLVKCIGEIGKRVEILREQAISMEREKESLLATLQDIQDNSSLGNFSQEQRDDIEYCTERLIVRCLTVDVSVTTPRNESQETAYKSVEDIIHKLQSNIIENPLKYKKDVISHLNACLPEPVTNSINLRFQDKILSCTADDQKMFRKRLEEILEHIRTPGDTIVDHTNSCNTESSQVVSEGSSGIPLISCNTESSQVVSVGSSTIPLQNGVHHGDASPQGDSDFSRGDS